MNIIKSKLRAAFRQDMLNKSMKVALAQYKFDAEEVLLDWIHLSEKGSQALILGDVKIPSIFAIRKKYKKNVKRTQKRKAVDVVLTSDSEPECL